MSKALKYATANPVFIVSSPRSGSTLLHELLIRAKGIWSIGGESHGIYAKFPHLRMENKSFDSGCLGEAHADEKTCRQFSQLFVDSIVDGNGEKLNLQELKKPIAILEKTPRNSLNIPFINKVFPRARFIFLHREPKANISSIIEAWQVGLQSGRFVTFKKLPSWDLEKWCLLLPPGWRDLNGRPLAEIAAFQWAACNKVALSDLSQLDAKSWVSVSYERLLSNPTKEIERLCKFIGVGVGNELQASLDGDLPLSSSVVSKPDVDKWKRHEEEILLTLDRVEPTVKLISSLRR